MSDPKRHEKCRFAYIPRVHGTPEPGTDVCYYCIELQRKRYEHDDYTDAELDRNDSHGDNAGRGEW